MSIKDFRLTRLEKAAILFQADVIIASLPANISYLTNGYKSIPQSILHRAQAYAMYVPESQKTVYIVSCAEIPSVVEFAGSDASIYCFGEFRFALGSNILSNQVNAHCKKSFPSADDALLSAINDLKLKNIRIALDEGRVSPRSWEKLSSLPNGNQLFAGSSLFLEARRIKHADEINGIETATVLAEQSLLSALNGFHAGMSELDLELKYRAAMAARGGDPCFYVGVADLRAAYSDTKNTTQAINTGSHIRFDFGGIYQGYYSDLARTASAGKPSDKLRDCYNAILQGTEQAIAAIKPGISAKEIFEIAVKQTRLNGIPGYSRHHCGHGIGIEMYDLPSIDPKTDVLLEENMVLCIETPYYELGWGGVQIESTVAVTKQGVRYLDKTDRNLIILD